MYDFEIWSLRKIEDSSAIFERKLEKYSQNIYIKLSVIIKLINGKNKF